ncbi:UvrD-helicase domain-containing protein [Shinella sp.]|uniref:UvrD-helicase domain-containing protein n=1 Tax=Shinella sp. TaxID=1870904 RepID=UPI003F718B85
MTDAIYKPTAEQRSIIEHPRDAFVRACPGAGKTRTMVERARFLLSEQNDRRSVAFLSFTNAAVDELTSRLRAFGVLPRPLFPNYIGTFDGFLWQFLITPFGVPGYTNIPRLLPDKKNWIVKPPFEKARPLPLECFDRETGLLIQAKADEIKFVPKNGPKAWETIAKQIIEQSLMQGQLDFNDVRNCVKKRLKDKDFAARIGAALSGRFREVIVDEAQDCNPADLEVIAWLREAGLTVKLICDPNQGIYGFRGGVTDELGAFASTFDEADHLPMSGNFRSSPQICGAINQLRPPISRGNPDQAVGRYRNETTPVHLLSYAGSAVSPAIGAAFLKMVQNLGIDPKDCPVLASTWLSASNAAGRRAIDGGNDKTLILAQSVMSFLSAFETGNRRNSLERLHRAVLVIRGHIAQPGDYGIELTKPEYESGEWRSEIISIGQALQLESGETADQWLSRARILLDKDLVGSQTINQRLKNNSKLGDIFKKGQATDLPALSIHAVKGLEFPAVCLVLVPQTTGKILDVLNGSNAEPETVEAARKIYVAGSRAQRLLAIATPKSQVASLQKLLDASGKAVVVLEV